MALYNIIQRQVIIRANQLKANSASALATAYDVTNIGDTEMGDRATSFPKKAIDDAILGAGGRMVELIGLDKDSHYRTYFAGVTSNLAGGVVTGTAIPTTSSASKPIIGVIGNVRDSSTGKRVTASSYESVIRMINLASSFNQSPHHFYTDNTKIWHTRTNVVADVVIWSDTDQRGLLESNPRGACPFPESLFAALVEGALSFLFRGEFNIQQAEMHWNRWNTLLQDAGIRTQVEQRIAVA